MADLHDKKLLPNGIGIAIDLHSYWTGAGNTQVGYFDNWHQMLSEQIGVLEVSHKKEGGKRYREELAEDVNKGTARALRLLRPLSAPPPPAK